jgi:uracil-DNA glycosylase family 4
VSDSWEALAADVRGCPRCRLAESRTNAVPGHGAPDAPLLLVGEAPGAKEDATGLPFQGLAGRFLDRSLGELGVTRERVYITSTNKCRPPRNRNPRPDEVAACAPYLDRQLALLRPRVVLAMGGIAASRLHPECMPGKPPRVADLRGLPIPLGPEQVLLVTYHPAAAQRFPAIRDPFKGDLAEAVTLAGLAGAA